MPRMRRTRQFILITMIVLAALGAILIGDAFAAVAVGTGQLPTAADSVAYFQ